MGATHLRLEVYIARRNADNGRRRSIEFMIPPF